MAKNPKPGKRVFLTGATGSMGLEAMRALVQEGHEVVGVARSTEGRAAVASLGGTPVEVDVLDEAALREATAGADVIAHFATSIPRGMDATKRTSWHTNDLLRREGTQSLIAAAEANGIERIIFESIALAYPDCGDAWIDESVPLEPLTPSMGTAIEAEAMLERFQALGGEAVSLRFGRIYGAGRASVDLIAALRKRQMPIVGRGDNYVSSVHIADAGTAVAAALRVPAGVYNVVDDEPLAQRRPDGRRGGGGGRSRATPRSRVPRSNDVRRRDATVYRFAAGLESALSKSGGLGAALLFCGERLGTGRRHRSPCVVTMGKGDLFSEHRAYLFAVAYRLVGTVEDAEDVLQDAWLRLSTVDTAELANPRAYLVTVVTRLALDVLSSARRRREDYVGVWLPEPVPSSRVLPRDLVEQAESASFAFLIMLERLNPVERAALVLHDVFEYSHQEIADSIDRTPEASRQALHRARQKLSGVPRKLPAANENASLLAEQFLQASQSGDVDKLLATLAADVVFMSDGGGKVRAASRPLVGNREVGRFLAAVRNMAPGNLRLLSAELNGQRAMLSFEGETLTNAFLFDATSEGITAIYVVRNPDKLKRLAPRGPSLPG